MHTRIVWLLLGVALATFGAAAAEPDKTKEQTLLVVDGEGKEHQLTAWKFTAETRRLNWLSPKDKAGPEAFEFRAENSTTFAEGVLTLVPLERLRALAYDGKMSKVTLTAATGPKPDDSVKLSGSTGYKGVNRPTLAGTEGTEKREFACGVEKGIQSAKFPAPPVKELPAGRPAVLDTRRNGDGSTTHSLTDLQPLYRFADESEVLSSTLYCKTLKAEVAKIEKITRSAGQGDEIVWVISRKGLDDETERVLPNPMIDGKEATLIGLVGRVPAGYELIPVLIVQEIRFDEK